MIISTTTISSYNATHRFYNNENGIWYYFTSLTIQIDMDTHKRNVLYKIRLINTTLTHAPTVMKQWCILIDSSSTWEVLHAITELTSKYYKWRMFDYFKIFIFLFSAAFYISN